MPALFHQAVGDVGRMAVVAALLSALLGAIAYFLSTRKSADEARSWRRFARVMFLVHLGAIVTIGVCLYQIIHGHYYEYHYAWAHSSNRLPLRYVVSCFWEGQEGSFLLWMFWHAVLSGLLILLSLRSKSKWEAPTMTVIFLVQVFLSTMILGAAFGEVRIGSTPFLLLRDYFANAPVFLQNPSFVPTDGSGLNPLLQNYWMVIHPPVLFLGFALTTVPFAFAIAGLWTGDLKGWLRPALPWILVGGGILGLGILMGAAWAYETLNFGGVWNWDPVENAVYVPWLVLVGGLHGVLMFRRKGKGLALTTTLVIFSFLLILYSTFLTRSGILGESSVHSFTDLGLSGQLLIYLLFFVVLAIAMLAVRWSKLADPKTEGREKSGLYWLMVAGISTLLIAGFQVIFATSFPVINKIFGSKLVVEEQVQFYTDFQIWPAVILLFLSALGQWLWWRNQKTNWKAEARGVMLAAVGLLVVSVLLILYLQIQNDSHTLELQKWGSEEKLLGDSASGFIGRTLSYSLLLLGGLFSVFLNGKMFFRLLRQQPKLVGGTVAHLGLALLLIGMLFSAGYSKVVSINRSGLTILNDEDIPENYNAENVVLFRGRPIQMAGYRIAYRGAYYEAPALHAYVNDDDLYDIPTVTHLKIARKPILVNGEVLAQANDTIEIREENRYFRVDYQKEGAAPFSLYPRAQVNEKMGGLIPSPDIDRRVMGDLYTHVTLVTDPDNPIQWRDTVYHDLSIGDTIFINDYVAVLDTVVPTRTVQGTTLEPNQMGLSAHIKIFAAMDTLVLTPAIVLDDQEAFTVPDESEEAGARLTFLRLNTETPEKFFRVGINTKQLDYVVLKAEEKPLINLLWAGCILMTLGFGLAAWKRAGER